MGDWMTECVDVHVKKTKIAVVLEEDVPCRLDHGMSSTAEQDVRPNTT
jgi:hypothetical protein